MAPKLDRRDPGDIRVRAMGGIPEPSFLMYGVIRNNLSGANVRLTSGTLTWTIAREGGSPLTLQTTLTNINDQFSYALQVPLESPMPGIAPDPDALQLSATSVQFDRSQVRESENTNIPLMDGL